MLPRAHNCPAPSGHGAPIIQNENEYEALRPYLYTDQILSDLENDIRAHRRAHEGEDYTYWFTLEGFFWFPRTLFGIENHLFAFYDYPELMHRINQDLVKFHKRTLEVIYSEIEPAFMTFAEDMSYNNGPMLSHEQYNEFMLPYYQELVPTLRAHDTKVLIDTDGFVEPLIPWFLEGGIEGILPLERMAGVDVNRIREDFPDLLMIGGFDKTVMHKGEAAMRAEFERILPAIRSGGYIPSVDHQTPPNVDMDTYRVYMRLLREYAEKSADNIRLIPEGFGEAVQKGSHCAVSRIFPPLIHEKHGVDYRITCRMAILAVRLFLYIRLYLFQHAHAEGYGHCDTVRRVGLGFHRALPAAHFGQPALAERQQQFYPSAVGRQRGGDGIEQRRDTRAGFGADAHRIPVEVGHQRRRGDVAFIEHRQDRPVGASRVLRVARR